MKMSDIAGRVRSDLTIEKEMSQPGVREKLLKTYRSGRRTVRVRLRSDALLFDLGYIKSKYSSEAVEQIKKGKINVRSSSGYSVKFNGVSQSNSYLSIDHAGVEMSPEEAFSFVARYPEFLEAEDESESVQLPQLPQTLNRKAAKAASTEDGE